MEFEVFASLAEDINNNWVWLPKNIIPGRTIVKIKNCKRTVYCEALAVDENFIKRYNSQKNTRDIKENDKTLIVINEWYRKKLDIRTKEKVNLEIKITESLLAKFCVALQHPQVVIKLSIYLAIFSLFISLCSVLIALL